MKLIFFGYFIKPPKQCLFLQGSAKQGTTPKRRPWQCCQNRSNLLCLLVYSRYLHKYNPEKKQLLSPVRQKCLNGPSKTSGWITFIHTYQACIKKWELYLFLDTILGLLSVLINITRILGRMIQLEKKKLREYDIRSNRLIMRTGITEIWQKPVKRVKNNTTVTQKFCGMVEACQPSSLGEGLAYIRQQKTSVWKRKTDIRIGFQ